MILEKLDNLPTLPFQKYCNYPQFKQTYTKINNSKPSFFWGNKKLTFTTKLKNKESYLESVSVLDPRTIAIKKRILRYFSEFCQAKFKESDEEIISELMKQSQEDRVTNGIDLLQYFINHLTKTVRPITIKNYVPKTAIRPI